MEHYLLCIWNGTLSDVDQSIVTKFWDTLFPNDLQCQYTFDFSKDIAALLKPLSKYFTVLNASQLSEKTEWRDLLENVKEIFSEVDNTEHIDITNEIIEQISVSIHSLADQLPAFGTYKLDVLIGSNILKNLSVSKEPLLSNAFFRLATWHSAFFTILIQEEIDQDRLNEWCEIINADVLPFNNGLKLGPSLWRGAVQFQTSNREESASYQGFELKLDLIENGDKILFHSVDRNVKTVKFDHVVLSPKLQVIDEISFASIPPYMLTPVAFRLRTGKPNILNENSSYLSNYLLRNERAALIMRLQYAEINEKIKPERKYSTSRWQKAVSAGCFKDPECFVSSFNSYITFAVTKSRKFNHVLAYPLRDSKSLNENFVFSMMKEKMSKKSSCPGIDCKENILSDVPYIEASDFQEIFEKYWTLSFCMPANGSLESNTSNIPHSLSFWQNIKKACVVRNWSMKPNAADLLFVELDPSDWPERIQLLCKQIQKEEKVPESALVGQNLKLPQQSFSISSKDISQYFLSSGEPKNSIGVEVLNPLNINLFVTHDLEEILHMDWPEIMNCGYHDLYYNYNCQAEDKESLGSQMVNLYIQHETASSCNKQQIIQSFSITVSEKNASPKKEFKSPSCRRTNFNQRIKRDGIASKDSIKELLTKKVLFSSKISPSQSSNKVERLQLRTANGVAKRNSQSIRCSPRKKFPVSYNASVRSSPRKKMNPTDPVRCSPRKKYPVNYNCGPTRCSPRKKAIASSSNQVRCSPRKKCSSNYQDPSTSRSSSSSQNSNKTKSSMSDLLRKKIRSAVATALENNGINLSHSFYQPCGSRLFAIVTAFVQDLPLKKGKTTEYLQKIADAHVKQVIEFFKE